MKSANVLRLIVSRLNLETCHKPMPTSTKPGDCSTTIRKHRLNQALRSSFNGFRANARANPFINASECSTIRSAHADNCSQRPGESSARDAAPYVSHYLRDGGKALVVRRQTKDH